MKKTILKAKNIQKSYPGIKEDTKVLLGIDLEVEENETLAIMGKSGEGKSTLLHILGTLESYNSGSLEVCSYKTPSPSTLKIRNEKIGFVFQAYNLLEDYTALENVLMPAKIGRKPTQKGSEAYERALLLLDLVGLNKRAFFLTKLLSGGEKQRVAIARALMNNPDLILADEPSGNLDSTTSSLIHDLLLSTVKEMGKTLIVVTHDKELASSCDRTLLLKDGILCTS